MPPFYDTHCHIDFPNFSEDIADVVDRARAAGIAKIICVGTDLESSRRAIRLGERFASVYAAVGWHPNDVMDAPDDVRPALLELCRHPKVVAIGETGLDYHWLPSRQDAAPPEEDRPVKERQAKIFVQQLEVAAETGLNVIVHQRGEVLEETLRLMQPFQNRVRGQFHCFSGTPEDLGRVLAMGSLVSFTGILTFKNGENVREALAAAPMNAFMLETDSPFLVPVPHRGKVKRCEPAFVREISEKAAEVKGCTLEELSAATCATAQGFFPKLQT